MQIALSAVLIYVRSGVSEEFSRSPPIRKGDDIPMQHFKVLHAVAGEVLEAE